MKIVIKNEFADDYTTREAGEKLRKKIIQNQVWPLELDFSDIKIASASFFDESIAKLSLEGFTTEMVNKKLHFLNLHKLDAQLLIQVCSGREINLKLPRT